MAFPRQCRWSTWAVFLLAANVLAADGDANPLRGRWSVREHAGKPLYLFRDSDREADLFSYHMRDSNKDGIDEVRLSHERDAIVMQSQGYPNHPTADFPNSGNPNSIRVQEFTFRLPLELGAGGFGDGAGPFEERGGALGKDEAQAGDGTGHVTSS